MATELDRIERRFDVAVVGGGLAGLAAATLAARAGRAVVLFDKGKHLGGRACSYSDGEFVFNLGPHALYRRGPGARVLRELGVAWTGGVPGGRGFRALDQGRLHLLPTGAWAMFKTGLFGLREKFQIGRLLARLGKIRPRDLEGRTASAWIEDELPPGAARRFMAALIRVSTYAADQDRLGADAAVAKLQSALAGGVQYLDGGWQTLVDGLRSAADAAGVWRVGGERVEAVEQEDGSVRVVRLGDGTSYQAPVVILAVPVQAAADLVPASETLKRWASSAVPVQAACLNLALRRLPRPDARFVLGVDQSLYLSVHSEWAKLGPPEQAAVYAMKYLQADERGAPEAHRRELEQLLDLAQPGWRQERIAERYLPNLTVASDFPAASRGGLAARPGPEVPDVRGLFVAGDWVGAEDLLADASLASARQAVRSILSSRDPVRA
jgi:phytoene dehydrogenase-like protein